MLTAPDWALGSRYLRENAPELIPFIEKYGPCNLQPEAPEKYFGTLVTGIISQQLPPDVSLAMVKRLEETVGTPITPESIASAAESDLCSCGIMPQKVMYLKGFAEAVLNGEVTMDKFAGMTDSEITKQLIKIKGLGQWTAEMPLPPILFFKNVLKKFLTLTLCQNASRFWNLQNTGARGVRLPYGIYGRKNNQKTKRLCRKIITVQPFLY
mgnify:CR=1 FL=1